ncbi:hypothetical protein [Chlorogloea sp. CCALA 695]|uniref:hypothetical protein n=1 Tax=Chlorogloea sp. CCALA 695 TaxID=2107693 RepID=UPI000D04C455|nr:hypothetical protein [Chlorogloea sp. CCALA 695]PSB30829.1 hypothetical protein C7B70_15350 [Chlorogloea sp. CCALA 695]
MVSNKQIELDRNYGEWRTISIQGKQIFCECKCGVKKNVCKYALIKGRSTNCGCKNKSISLPINTVFGRLKVVSNIEEKSVKGELVVYVNCTCSQNIILVNKNSLKKGFTQSCGCLRNEIVRERKRIHGLSSSYEYKTWIYLKSICYNNNHRQYKSYGALGIEVSQNWRNDFTQFLHDMGTAPPGTTISRIDFAKNFTLNNCFWLTKSSKQKRFLKSSPDVFPSSIFSDQIRDYCALTVGSSIIAEHAAGEPDIDKLAFKYNLSSAEVINIILRGDDPRSLGSISALQ